ncbi:prefoldin subunit beta [Hyperthermus butylicus]|uniref:Prefoldin subunit beta n=1 Tax=Hyperthermus butylicus (strain DSM 5456 / JCM 9403 / PLM1-5) TaxID=415426 RepID=A2BKC4_HYPBU|nr:prefoldin subunit beta [Hyperthermus butylicus]ABM80435.1 Prefoldin beta subunit [Hyperthermus butylicus DSM 5456]
MAQRLPPELENKLVRLQTLQAQYNKILQERATVESEIAETQRAIKLIEEAGENAPVYRMEANVMVRVDRAKLLQELKDRLEILELRLQRLKKQEEEIRKQLDTLAKEIRELQTKLALGKQAGAGAS